MSAIGPILLVEDDPDDRELTIMSLRDSNIANAIDVVRDGPEALSYFTDPARPLPAVILLDLQLPRTSGLDVLKRLREDQRTRLVPIVMLTSSNEESDRQRSYDSGANAYVCKPVDFEGFTEAMRTLGLFWLVVNAPPPPPPVSTPGR